MPVIQGFDVPDEVYTRMIANLMSPKVCSGCGEKLGSVKDVRKEWYCSECIPKVSKLKRYSNGLYNPTTQERKDLFAGFKRAGGA